MFRPTFPVAALCAAVCAAAGGTASCRDVTAPVQDPTTATFAPTLGIRLSDFVKDTSGVYYRDIVVGSGPKVVPKSTIAYNAVGYLTNGRSFFSNVNEATRTAVVGNGEVVRGLDRGFLGMNQGGRRRVIIPPALGYGGTSAPNAIPAGSILIFDVDAAGVTPPAATPTTTSRVRPG